MKNILKETGIVVGVCVFFALMLTIFTPVPVSGLVNQMFANGGPATEPANYAEVKTKIKSEKDLSYDSYLGQNKFDVIVPKSGENFPVVIWVHGGAYVGGQKEDVSIYANTLAAEGYAVVNMEYELAPGSTYPGPLIQLDDLYQALGDIADSYSLDLSRLFFAGDSAGGQIAAQFVNLQVADQLPTQDPLAYLQVVPPATIKGVILFCAPLSFSGLISGKENSLLNFFGQRIGWAYAGEANWKNSTIVAEADLLKNVSGNFPATFISDGNYHSFEEQGIEFAEKLKAQATPVTDVFYTDSQSKLPHEYQFDFTHEEATATFAELSAFLASVNK